MRKPYKNQHKKYQKPQVRETGKKDQHGLFFPVTDYDINIYCDEECEAAENPAKPDIKDTARSITR